MEEYAQGDLVPIEITLIENDNGPVNKKLTINPGGTLRKESAANIYSGKAFRVPLEDWRYLKQIEDAAPTQAIALGRMHPDLPDMAFLTTDGNKSELAKPGRFSRTKGNIIYEAGKPAPVAIDFDDNGMPQSVRDQIESRGGLIGALESICPTLKTAAYVSRGSTSSGLIFEATGERKEGGSHHFVILTDGADAKRFLDDMFDRAWLNNLGWIQIGAAGSLMVRSIIDACVSDPIRLVFEGPPTLGLGLSQGPRPATIHEGVPLVCPPSLTKAEKAKVTRLINAAKKEAEPAGKAQRKVWGKPRVTALVASGSSQEEAELTIEQWAQGNLLPDALISFYRPKVVCVSVRDILDNPKAFDGWLCHHPIEGEDYTANGKYYADSNTIFTFGHAGQVFYLRVSYANLEKSILEGPEKDAWNIYKLNAKYAQLDKDDRRAMMKLIEDRTMAGSLRQQ